MSADLPEKFTVQGIVVKPSIDHSKFTHSQRARLQVKIQSLSSEISIIKQKEMKWIRKARMAADRQAKIQSNNSLWTYHLLREHRICVVRPETRAANVAYAYLRGLQYSDIEMVVFRQTYQVSSIKRLTDETKYDAFWRRVSEIVFAFMPYTDGLSKDDVASMVCKWRDASNTTVVSS